MNLFKDWIPSEGIKFFSTGRALYRGISEVYCEIRNSIREKRMSEVFLVNIVKYTLARFYCILQNDIAQDVL